MSENSLLVPNESNKCRNFKKSFSNLFVKKQQNESSSTNPDQQQKQHSRLTSTKYILIVLSVFSCLLVFVFYILHKIIMKYFKLNSRFSIITILAKFLLYYKKEL
jgi:hypothetical protein